MQRFQSTEDESQTSGLQTWALLNRNTIWQLIKLLYWWIKVIHQRTKRLVKSFLVANLNQKTKPPIWNLSEDLIHTWMQTYYTAIHILHLGLKRFPPKKKKKIHTQVWSNSNYKEFCAVFSIIMQHEAYVASPGPCAGYPGTHGGVTFQPPKPTTPTDGLGNAGLSCPLCPISFNTANTDTHQQIWHL